VGEIAFVAVDWGTTSFRLWAMDADGGVISERHGERGMSTLKPVDFEAVLEESLTALKIHAKVPVVICGMAGAAQGWVEAPYVDLPTRLETIPTYAIQVPLARRDVRILPGLAQRDAGMPDVMRGEETLLLGAALEKGVSGMVCLPGTHSKWVRIEASIVTGFATSMTGEIFDLLAHKSTLAHFICAPLGNLSDNPAFADALKEAIHSPEKILQLLFSVRATPLVMGAKNAANMAARLSGLLIGLEIAGMGQSTGDQVTLISGGVLAQIYARAFDIAGIEPRLLSADEMARAGLLHAARLLWPEQLNRKHDT